MQNHRALGILAGRSIDPDRLGAWIETAEYVIAADGGLRHPASMGRQIDAVIGDMDSLDPSQLRFARAVVKDPDQNTTDCQKLLGQLEGQGFRRAVLACVEGDLLDHQLDNLFTAARSAIRVDLLLEAGLVMIVKAGAPRSIATNAGIRVSLLPLTACSGVTLTGVRWPLEGAGLDPLGHRSISNEATGERIEASVASGVAALFVFARELDWTALEVGLRSVETGP